ncbi:MAG: hypothetical protein KKH93_01060 [Candidatus Omnitrophica bacterium]|nr:hypothetical protein [Candidatus Omnitrophota bacterium]MBU2251630.1 hypothetical protein [Candidatus Omnitrophota bacterium]
MKKVFMADRDGFLKIHLAIKDRYIKPKQDSMAAFEIGRKNIKTAKKKTAILSMIPIIFSL